MLHLSPPNQAETMQLKFPVLTSLLLAVNVLAFGQNDKPNQVSNTSVLQQRINSLSGTYEIRARSGTRLQPQLPSNLADIIERNRQENEDVTVHLNEIFDVVVYSRKRINNNKAH